MPSGTRAPDRLVMTVGGLTTAENRYLAVLATRYARRHAPKLTGRSASRIFPLWGRDHFGIRWADDRVWFQNSGVNPFIMRSLAGKTIPMWIDDPTGEERRKNPNAETRTTISGKKQVLIFRRAAQMYARKTVMRRVRGLKTPQPVSVPMSYPGAPGRIALRGPQQGNVSGKAAIANKRIARGNVGLRWYFPGLSPRNFLQHGLILACQEYGVVPGAIRTGYNFYTTPASVANKVPAVPPGPIPAYPRQPLVERASALAKKKRM